VISHREGCIRYDYFAVRRSKRRRLAEDVRWTKKLRPLSSLRVLQGDMETHLTARCFQHLDHGTRTRGFGVRISRFGGQHCEKGERVALRAYDCA